MPSAAQRLDQVPERPPGLRVEAGGRLVEEQQLGPADDAEGDVEPAALPAGQLPRAGPRLVLQADATRSPRRGRAGRG